MTNKIQELLKDMEGMRNVNFALDSKTLSMLNEIKKHYRLPNQATAIKFLIREKMKGGKIR